jgi:hypothetical protein
MNMEDDVGYKNCPQCGEKVRFTAKKCPHCMSWQGRKFSANNPTMAALASTLVIVLMMPVFFWFASSQITSINPPVHRFAEFRNRVVVLSPEMNYSEESGKRMISTMGRIRNDSPITWESVSIEVQYLNASGKLIDTASDRSNALTLEPNTDTAFRVRSEADKSRSEYATQVVILHDAADAHRY